MLHQFRPRPESVRRGVRKALERVGPKSSDPRLGLGTRTQGLVGGCSGALRTSAIFGGSRLVAPWEAIPGAFTHKLDGQGGMLIDARSIKFPAAGPMLRCHLCHRWISRAGDSRTCRSTTGQGSVRIVVISFYRTTGKSISDCTGRFRSPFLHRSGLGENFFCANSEILTRQGLMAVIVFAGL